MTEQHIIGPVRANGADGERKAAHGDGVHGEHDEGKNRQRQHPVCHNPVNSVGQGQGVPGGFFLYRFADDRFDVSIPLVGNDGFRVVLQLPLTVGNMLFQMGHDLIRQP